uniref:Uncharacterized protein n=1 Tax=viral metagenome TaxID=1070528 RepID=A0A6M3M705_9ZZZZ
MKDENYYMRKARHDEKRKRALAKARKRGEVATEWFKTNKLTYKTKPEFDKLMKDTDGGFNDINV